MDREILPRKFDIFWSTLPDVGGSVQIGTRPVVIVQNNVGNGNSTTVIIVPLTSKNKRDLPTHVELPPSVTSFALSSTALCEQIQTIPIDRLKYKMGEIREYEYKQKINDALRVSLALN